MIPSPAGRGRQSEGAPPPSTVVSRITRFDSRFAGLSWSGRVVWVFRSSAVAASDQDPASLLTLLTDGHSLVPLGIGLPLDSLPLEPGQRISVADGFLTAGSLGDFRLHGAGTSLSPAAKPLSLDVLQEHLDALGSVELSDRQGPSRGFARNHAPTAPGRAAPSDSQNRRQAPFGEVSVRVSRALAVLGRSLLGETSDASAMNDAARTLSGLGPGLTPSGDDILVGLLAEASVLTGAGFLDRGRESLLRSAVRSAPPTTPVALAMRRHALTGEFPEALARFVEVLGSPVVSRRQLLSLTNRLLGLGAQSGADLLSGALFLARAVVLKGQPR
ncbi:MAG: DUF2877 domain-containing protein [Thermoanaerobaculia bacterium]|nr:DUF2877 domain-containing protein [Thermoanaerobaculia bacterium]